MKSLTREAIIRMTGNGINSGGVGGGGGGTDLSGYATQLWVDENYLSIEFFSKLFKAYNGSTLVNPNDTESTIDNIKAMFGFWTNQYISALGQNSGGGGGGASALTDLVDVAISSPTNGQALVYNATSQKWENQTIGGGSGTLTSIGLVMPTGFSVSPATLTANGSFTVSFANGYALPTTADVNKGVTAYGWGNHANAGYLTSSDLNGYATQTWVGQQGFALSSNVYSKTDADSKFLTIVAFENLFNAMASDGTTKIDAPYASSVASIKAKFGLWTQQYLSALGLNSGGSGSSVALSDLVDVSISSPTNGQVLKYNSTSGKWENAAESGGGGGTGTVTSITAGTGLSGGTITTSGTIAINSTYQSYISHGETAYGWGNHADAGYLTGITSNMVTTALGFTPLSNATTFWGQASSNGVVSGSIEAGLSGGVITGFHSIELNSHGSLSNYGGFIDFHFDGSSSDYTSRIIEDASGRLYLDADNGVRIGNAVLKWDSTNNALKIQKSDGTAANLYATGGVSALGMSSGTSSIDAMTFNYVTVNNRITLKGSGHSHYIYGDSNGALVIDGSECILFENDIDTNGNSINTNGGDIYARRFYLDSSCYIYLDSGTLKYYNGSTSKTISVY